MTTTQEMKRQHFAERAEAARLTLDQFGRTLPTLDTLRRVTTPTPVKRFPCVVIEGDDVPRSPSPFDFLTQGATRTAQDIAEQRNAAREQRREAVKQFIEVRHGDALNLLSIGSDARREYDALTSWFVALDYDAANARNYTIAPTTPRPVCVPDVTQYRLINKKVRYADMSVFAVLKLLYSEHKINRASFKDAIKRAHDGKPQREKVREMINRYWGSLKSKAIKNTLSRLTAPRRPFIMSEQNGARYHVVILRRTARRLETWERLERLDIDAQIKEIFTTEQTDLTYMSRLSSLVAARRVEERRRAKVAEIVGDIREEHKTRLINGNVLSLLVDD